jgi:hypothetical protein
MEHALPTSLSAITPEPPPITLADDAAPAVPWHARVTQFFQIEFAELDDLDLGTRSEFNTYICDLFERGPCVKS